MRTTTLLAVLAAFTLAPCLAAPVIPRAVAKSPPGVAWSFDRHNDRIGNPHTSVFLRVGGRSVLIVRSAEDEFRVLDGGEYRQFQVPPGAVCACTGQWGGQGEDLYVTRRGGRLMVFIRATDEETGPGAYTRRKSIPVR